MRICSRRRRHGERRGYGQYVNVYFAYGLLLYPLSVRYRSEGCEA